MPLLFALAASLAAALLFLVEPMAAKMALPILGGSASVWTTAMMFFQAALVLGYAWAHLLGTRLPLRAQLLAHLGLLAVAAAALPPAFRGGSLPPVDASPIPWLAAALARGFGLPFVALAATGPLVQSWFAASGHTRAHDPYFLYAASNAGSFAGLLAYPFLVEPHLPLRAVGLESSASGLTQSGLWVWGYALFAATALGCAVAIARGPGRAAAAQERSDGDAPSWRTRAGWVVLAALPSSATLSTTQYVTTDLAAVPLLWVVPLAIYLLTFVVAFAPRIKLPLAACRVAFGLLAVATTVSLFPVARRFGAPLLLLPLATLAALGLFAHGSLAARRPDRRHLTDYFLSIAVGGALGGAFNALAAPLLFTSIAEYPIVLALVAFVAPPDGARERRTNLSAALDLAVAGAILGFSVLLSRATPRSAAGATWLAWVQAVGPALLASATVAVPRRFAWSLAVLLAAAWTATLAPRGALAHARTFYGVYRVMNADGPTIVVQDVSGRERTIGQKFHVLAHGTTRHGSQSTDPERRRVPTTYYHPSGPLGDIVRALRLRGPIRDAGLVGLGAGTIAAYGEPGERFTYFEIDSGVARLARDPALFTYLADARATTSIVLGDGRRSLAASPDGHFDLIVLDAFSSDAIPTHLLTRDALAVYLRKLAPGGCLAFHLTNTYLELEPVVGAIAASLGAPAAVLHDLTRTPEQAYEGKDLSKWAVVARPGERVPVEGMGGWERLSPDVSIYPARFLWTDDRSDILGALLAR